jgi:hypothetical protein
MPPPSANSILQMGEVQCLHIKLQHGVTIQETQIWRYKPFIFRWTVLGTFINSTYKPQTLTQPTILLHDFYVITGNPVPVKRMLNGHRKVALFKLLVSELVK